MIVNSKPHKIESFSLYGSENFSLRALYFRRRADYLGIKPSIKKSPFELNKSIKTNIKVKSVIYYRNEILRKPGGPDETQVNRLSAGERSKIVTR